MSQNYSGAKWLLWLLVMVFALGFNVKDAKWMNGKIAEATAEQINLATEIERQKADLDLQILRTQTEIQIEQRKQQAEIVAARQHRALEAEWLARLQWAEFSKNIYEKFIYGRQAILAEVSILLVLLGANAGLSLNQSMKARAQANPQLGQVDPWGSLENRRIAAARARDIERRQNIARIILSQSSAYCSSDNREAADLEPGSYPLAG